MFFKKVLVFAFISLIAIPTGFSKVNPDYDVNQDPYTEPEEEPMDWYDADSEFEALFRVTGEQIIDKAKNYIGRPYRHGSMGPRSFDCSGFTSYVYKSMNIRLNRTSQDQYRQGIAVDKDEVVPGDLVFFSSPRSGRGIGHVGIVCSVEDDGSFKFIHAACHSGVTISSINERYYATKYRGAKRIL